MTGRERRVIFAGVVVLGVGTLLKAALLVSVSAAERRTAAEHQDVLLERTRAVAMARDRVDSVLQHRVSRQFHLSAGLLPDPENGGPIGSLAAVLNVWGIESSVIIERTEIVVDTLGFLPRVDVRMTCRGNLEDLATLIQRIEQSDLILSVRQFDIVPDGPGRVVRATLEVSAWMRGIA